MISKRYRTWPFPIIKRTVGDKHLISRGLSKQALERLRKLEDSYDLSAWPRLCTPREFIANLYVLDILDKTFPDKPLCASALDVGSAKWWYLPALKAFLSTPWTGIELSANQRGKRFDNWLAHAEYFCNAYHDACYHNMCITELKQRYSFITWFLPYVALNPLISAGLPEYYFDPAGLLRHVWNRLEPGGVLFIVNQGEAEAILQQKILTFERLDHKSTGKLTSSVKPFQYERFGWVIHKPEN